MSAAYVLSVTHQVLSESWRVTVRYGPQLGDDYVTCEYELEGAKHVVMYDRGLAGIHGGTLRKICDDLGLPFDEVRRQIEKAGGLWRRPGDPG